MCPSDVLNAPLSSHFILYLNYNLGVPPNFIFQFTAVEAAHNKLRRFSKFGHPWSNP
jgi:hypothetical protein